MPLERYLCRCMHSRRQVDQADSFYWRVGVGSCDTSSDAEVRCGWHWLCWKLLCCIFYFTEKLENPAVLWSWWVHSSVDYESWQKQINMQLFLIVSACWCRFDAPACHTHVTPTSHGREVRTPLHEINHVKRTSMSGHRKWEFPPSDLGGPHNSTWQPCKPRDNRDLIFQMAQRTKRNRYLIFQMAQIG